MNAFSKPLKLETAKVLHGRKGQAKEYIEYRLNNTPVNFVAQKSGEWFHLYRVERGRNASVQTLGSFSKADSAAHAAHDAAMNEAGV